MSERPIAVGDLVCVVRDHECGCPSASLGMVFVVERIALGNGTVTTCDHRVPIVDLYRGPNNHPRAELSRLRRIPPLSELESERREEKEPA